MGTKAELAIPVLLELIDPLSGTSRVVHNCLLEKTGGGGIHLNFAPIHERMQLCKIGSGFQLANLGS